MDDSPAQLPSCRPLTHPDSPPITLIRQMRDTYGKLIYLLMDASDPEIQELLEFK